MFTKPCSPRFMNSLLCSKPFHDIWKELNGHSIIPLEPNEKDAYASIQKFKTFSPASHDRDFVFAQLCKNIEATCMKARRYKFVAHGAMCLLRTQDFRDNGVEVRFTRGTAFAHEVIHALTPAFSHIFRSSLLYRSTGVVLVKLKADTETQLNLFDPPLAVEEMQKLYQTMDALREKYGKYMVVFGASFLAHKFAQHVGERGDAPARRRALFKGETARKRLGIPMLLGQDR